MQKGALQNFRFQRWVAIVSVLLFAIKIIAWWITHSVSILTDALESIVNIFAGFIGLYSLYVAAKPRDKEHPYGHGKAEFVSAAVEGTLILVAGIAIIYKAIMNLISPTEVSQLDYGILLILISGIINFAFGHIAEKIGKKNQSSALIASGKHLKTDTYTTVGIVLGLLLLFFTKIWWIDSVVALVFAFLIIFTGIKIIRSSLAGIMDEADESLLEEMVQTLNIERNPNWIDLHNMRIIKYGNTLHIDCHLTVPWYFNVNEAHNEVESVSEIVDSNFENAIEMFIHTDGCLPISCPICSKENCSVRQSPFQKKIEWNVDNVRNNNKHTIDSISK